jgi:hypothetical protein
MQRNGTRPHSSQEIKMNRYEPGTPRTVFGIVAVVMMTITLVLFVILPAQVEANGQVAFTVTASQGETPSTAA